MVRRASDADIDAVLAFAAQIFADEQDIPKELNFIPADKQPQWWCMEQDGELVGTAAIYREDGQWHMGRITVARRLRGLPACEVLVAPKEHMEHPVSFGEEKLCSLSG